MAGTFCASSMTTTAGAFVRGSARERCTRRSGSRRYSARSPGLEKSSHTAVSGRSRRSRVDFPVCLAPKTMCTYGARKRVLHAGSIQRPNIIWTSYLPDYYKVKCVIGLPTRREPEGPQRGPDCRRRDSLPSEGEVRTGGGVGFTAGKGKHWRRVGANGRE